VVIVNKWDVVEKDEYTLVEFTRRLRSELHFLDYVPVLFVSAKTGQRTDQILPTALRVQEERLVRIPTSELNRIVRDAVAEHPPASQGNHLLKLNYATQVRTHPPSFLFHVNDPTWSTSHTSAISELAAALQLHGHAAAAELPQNNLETGRSSLAHLLAPALYSMAILVAAGIGGTSTRRPGVTLVPFNHTR
jgi:hypothetical protein